MQPDHEACASADAEADGGHKRPILSSPKVSALTGLITLVLGLSLTALFSGGAQLSTDLYLAAAGAELFDAGYVISEVALLTLVAAWGLTAIVLALRRSARRLVLLVIGGVGACLAYGTSELLKLVIANTRPCNAYEVVVASCPSAENWSYPSNHTVIAWALAAALIAAVPRAGVLVVPAALLAGSARVFAGHHYPHDVLGGTLLGISVTVGLILLTAPAILSRCSLRFSKFSSRLEGFSFRSGSGTRRCGSRRR